MNYTQKYLIESDTDRQRVTKVDLACQRKRRVANPCYYDTHAEIAVNRALGFKTYLQLSNGNEW